LSAARMARRVGTTVTVMIDGWEAGADAARRGPPGEVGGAPGAAGCAARGYAARTAGSAWEVDGAGRIAGAAAADPAARSPGSLARVRILGSTPYDLSGRFEAAADPTLPLVGGRS